MARVLLEGLTKVYPGGMRAVESVDLDVAHGEFVVLVGPSGCGKSTTLRMVAGLEEISRGELRIGERLVNEVPARERDIAMVFQSYALYPHLSVRKNLAFGLERRREHASWLRRRTSSEYRARGRAEDAAIAQKIVRAAATLGIETLMDRKPGELSGGQRQRVAVGRALVREPAVFLFDEPLSNLDAKLRVEMRAEIKELHRVTGATMLYVTHDQEEAMTLGDRLVVMKDGCVQQCASPTKVYERPANRFVAGFVGTPAMNFLDARVERGPAGFELALGAARLAVPEARAAELAPHAGTTLVLGLRPDRIRLTREGEVGSLPAEVRLRENLGDRVDLRLTLQGGQPLVLRLTEARHGAPSEGRVAVQLELAEAHFFEAGENGRRTDAAS